MPVPHGMRRRELPIHEQRAVQQRQQERARMNAHFSRGSGSTAAAPTEERNTTNNHTSKEALARSGGLHQLLRHAERRDTVPPIYSQPSHSVSPTSEGARTQPSHPHNPTTPHNAKSVNDSLAAAVAANLAALEATTGRTLASRSHTEYKQNEQTYSHDVNRFEDPEEDHPSHNHHLANSGHWGSALTRATTHAKDLLSFPSVPSQATSLYSMASDRTHIPHNVDVLQSPPKRGGGGGGGGGGGVGVTQGKPSSDSRSPSRGQGFEGEDVQGEVREERGRRGGGGGEALQHTVQSLNSRLQQLQLQVGEERKESARQAKAAEDQRRVNTQLEERNRTLQDSLNRCNEEVAQTLRRSGEEMAQQWQDHTELQIKLNEQTMLLRETSDRLREVTTELRQKDALVDNLRGKLRDQDERLKSVASLAQQRQNSVASTVELPPPRHNHHHHHQSACPPSPTFSPSPQAQSRRHAQPPTPPQAITSPRESPQPCMGSRVDTRCAPSPTKCVRSPQPPLQPQPLPQTQSGDKMWEDLKTHALEVRLQKLEKKLAPLPSEPRAEMDIEDLLPFEIPVAEAQMLPPPTTSHRPKVGRAKGDENHRTAFEPVSQMSQLQQPPPSLATEEDIPSQRPNTSVSSLQSHDSLLLASCEPASALSEPDHSALNAEKPDRIPKKTTPNRGMGTAWLVP